MTVIAFDGKQLAGDKQTNDAGLAARVTKVQRIGSLLVGGCGNAQRLRELHEWVAGGRKKDDLPAFQRSHDTSVSLLVIDGGRILAYEGSHAPLVIEEPFYAIGSGRDYAIAAMYLGRSAREAVEVASRFCTGCGLGVDVLELESPMLTLAT